MAISEREKMGVRGKAELIKEGKELEAFARELGADIYGVAAAEAFKEFPEKPQPGRFVPDAKSVIIVGMPNSPELFATVARPSMAEVSRQASEDAGRSQRDMDKPPAGAERYFINEEQAMLSNEVVKIGYKINWKLHQEGYKAF